jgi:glyoxylase-like metal-dependent hydrolase (beta-lactamase superfamily II)
MANWPFRQGVHEIADGSYGYIQPDGTWGWSNAGLVTSGGQTLLIDTLMSVPLTREMLAAFARVPGGERIDMLMNTHANPDHFFGNGVVEGAEIISTAKNSRGDGRASIRRRSAISLPTGRLSGEAGRIPVRDHGAQVRLQRRR